MREIEQKNKKHAKKPEASNLENKKIKNLDRNSRY